MRKGILVAVLALAPLALAQAPTVAPTKGNGPDAYAKGADSASVNQTIELILPKATALHLDVTTLTFDLTGLDGASWPNSTPDFGGQMVCVYGLSDKDVKTQLGYNFYNQVQTLPLGTSYGVAQWPNITINGGGAVTAYPPIKLDNNGELVPGSKNYFVCYRTFILQKFSNGKQWHLTVNRNDPEGAQGIQHLYIQDNPCDTFGEATGLYELPNGANLELVPRGDLQAGPTGTRSGNNPERCGYKSWLDDLVVVAVKVNSDLWGKSTANLTYTLATTAW
ncbi:hypothetical protein [uncultured Thermus sp.]|uniref:hypothetical protein n=1 Tax=uncultured Thermus sp. TaxID=157149 RepID=UPI0026272702|nr:hypothetical protein [uncultured Thermus sp.]